MNQPPDPHAVAPRWRRLLARALDLLIVGVAIIALLFVAHKFNFERPPVPDLIIFGVLVGYEVILPAVWRGQSVGKRALGITVVSESTLASASVLRLLARFATRLALFAVLTVFVAYELELPSLAIVLAVEAVVGALQRRRQTLGDLVGRTVVVQTAHAPVHAAA